MRYSRLEALDAGMEQIRGKDVVVVGAGATGSRMLEQLARLGADLKVVDRDFLEQPNLATSALYTERQVEKGLPKSVAAAEKLGQVNSEARVEAEVADLNPRTADSLLDSPDIVMDGTDNLETRFLINEYCVKKRVPWVHVSALATSGEVMPVVPGGACFSCVFEGVDATSIETCETAGIHPAAASLAASTGVSEAVRPLHGEPSEGLTRFDVENRDFYRLDVERREDCIVCSREQFPHLEGEKGSKTISVCGDGRYQVNPGENVDLKSAAQDLQESGDVDLNPYLLKFRGDEEFTLFRDGRMIVEAGSPERARSIYSRFVGN